MQTDPLFLHIRVVMGIILGLSITTVLKGLAQIIEHPQRRGCSALHLGWVAWTLISLVTFWWWEFRLIEVHRWTFETYLFVIVYCATWFLLCALLFPDDLREYGSYGNYLMQRRRWIFSVIAALTLLDLVDTAIKGSSRWKLLGAAYPLHAVLMLAVAVLGWRLRSQRTQLRLVLATLAYQIGYFAVEYFTVGSD
ncbi:MULTISPECIES: hypothetical protein [Stenotrophomonas]|jgi:hypothetical protein|uniref:Uncharacterized protein n=1 Tax=Stenotrophomonas maltophilia TaxID=40324 RepID=A0A246ICY3_STEMA|nr:MULTISPECIES: hypothetical protein [Stenotrophomonas maltophilia group]CRR06054.1 hypothetical protein PAERUG_E15_London_28_01_14_07711 [Pseudomonas aeruginosa]MBA0272113.1 hypothetical protein [Stenotrophomonas maltophilia]MCO5738853.1 hypothetical protein [Stenotrophomonas maltophilia]MCZ7843145.1 hypothetical protein [Stenotrophomonas maltophilia]MDJ1624401.1 hypothetical protein [Stenotrophomonas sepilia]